MAKFILPGDRLLVEKSSLRLVRRGDILLFNHPLSSAKVAHRLVEIRRTAQGKTYGLAGDHFPLRLDWVQAELIQGRVQMIFRKERVIGPQELKFLNALFMVTRYFPLQFYETLKLGGIALLSWVQGFGFYRNIVRLLFRKSIQIFQDEVSNGVGFRANWRGLRAGSISMVWDGGAQADVVSHGVRARFRGMGIGRKLLEEAIATARQRKIQKICLRVWGKHAPVHRLYESLGFQYQKEEVLTNPCWFEPKRMFHLSLFSKNPD